jgi:diguanylate cyclase (GGDEF)-like protein
MSHGTTAGLTRARTLTSVLGFGGVDPMAPGQHVLLGRGLLLVCGLVVSVPMPLLHLSTSDLATVLKVTVAMTALLIVSLAVPWERLPRSAVLSFPIAVLAGLAYIGMFTGQEIGGCFTGLFVLCFAYAGVCCPQRSAYALLPLALPAYVATVAHWSTDVAIRLVVTAAVWTLIAELLAHLMRHQQLVATALQRASLTDELTTLANRRDFEARLPDLAVGDTVVICDLDHFKEVNDTRGHAAGDDVLRAFGEVLRGALRGDDYAARYGGEEFVLFLADTDVHQAGEVLDRLRRRWAGRSSAVTFSAGYALRSPGLTPVETLLAADTALYAAKDGGRDQHRASRTLELSGETARRH